MTFFANAFTLLIHCTIFAILKGSEPIPVCGFEVAIGGNNLVVWSSLAGKVIASGEILN